MGGLDVSTIWLNHWDGLEPSCWRVTGRGQPSYADAQLLLQVLTPDTCVNGFVLRGATGTGKRSLVRSIFREPETEAIWISGNRYSNSIAYGAIQFLLTELPSQQAQSPLAVYAHLERLFLLRKTEALLVIEHGGLVDPLTIAVLAQLAGNHAVKLIVIDDLVSDIPEEFAVLMRTGDLEVLYFDRLSLDEARTDISKALDRDISYLSALRLWDYSAGSIELLRALVKDCADADMFTNHPRAVALKKGPLPIGSSVMKHIEGRINRMSSSQREIVESVLRYGQLPASQAMFHADLDDLHSRRLVHQSNGLWRIASPVIAQVLAKLWGIVGVELPVVDFRTPRSCAANHSEDEFAPRAWSATKKSALQFLANNQLADGIHVLEGFIAREQSQNPELSNADRLEAQILLLDHFLRASRLNDAKKLIEYLELQQASVHWPVLATYQQHLAQALSAQYLARVNDHQAARQLLNGLFLEFDVSSVEGISEALPDIATTLRYLISTCVALGQWERCRSLTRLVLSGALPDTSLVAFAESIHALMLAVAGISVKARRIAKALDLQLQMTGSPAEIRLNEAILHGSDNEESAIDAAQAPLRAHPENNLPISLHECISQIIFSRGSRQELLRLTEWADATGETFMASLILAQRVRQGDFDSAPQLLALQKNLQHPLAEAFRQLAAGSMTSDDELITESLCALARFGYVKFVLGHSDGIYDLLSVSQKRYIARQANIFTAQVQHYPDTLDGQVNSTRFSVLTERERFVASAAANGLSNYEIAEQASLSVRTVEGHLYQVYSKLGISKRRELKALTGANTE